MLKRIDTMIANGYDLNSGKFSAAFCAVLEISENKLPAKVLPFLFENGANPLEYIKGKQGNFPILDEIVYRKLPVHIMVDIVDRIGLSYKYADFKNVTPFVLAVVYNYSELVEKLIA